MSGPRDYEQLITWWETGYLGRGEFFSYLLAMLDDDNVERFMAGIPADFADAVMPWARSICETHRARRPFFSFGGGPVASEASLEALCGWLERHGDP